MIDIPQKVHNPLAAQRKANATCGIVSHTHIHFFTHTSYSTHSMVVFMVLFLNLGQKKKKKNKYILYLYNTYMIGDGMRAMAGGCEKESVCVK